jgi:hypothetical protein
VNGAPAKPISGTRPRSSDWNLADGRQHVRQRLSRLEHAQAVDVSGLVDRPFELRSLAFDEVEGKSHRLERQEEVGEQDGGVQIDPSYRLQCHFGRQVRRPADVE